MDASEAETLRSSLLQRMKTLDSLYPGENTFASVIAQLSYIGGFILSDTKTMPRRAEINFGFLGMRFVREFDAEVAHDLATLDTYIEQRFT